MSSETDHPRQRTVAELLAEHGAAGPTGRRRRRRDDDASGGHVGAPSNGASGRGTPPRVTPPRGTPARGTPASGLPARGTPPRGTPPRGTPPQGTPARGTPPGGTPANGWRTGWSADPDRDVRPGPPQEPSGPRSPAGGTPITWESRTQEVPPHAPAVGRIPVDRPTDRMPPVRAGGRDGRLDGLVPQRRPDPGPAVGGDPDDADGGPPTGIGIPPEGAEAWHAARTASPPAGLRGVDEVGTDLRDDTGPHRRLGRASSDSAGRAWAPVLAQWILGALAGAGLWVGFRYLWGNLLVVAVAAAVLVTVGLVVIVRSLLRNDDMRTTLFAVLVGLLLTVSPAILPLLGR